MPRIKYLLLLLFLLPAGAHASWTKDIAVGIPPAGFTCSQGFSSSGVGNCSSPGGHCAAVGTLIVAIVSYYQSAGARTGTFADTNGYTWNARADTATAANNYRILMFDAVSTGSSCDTFTVTLSGSVTFGFIYILQFTSSLGSAAFDVNCSSTPSCWVSSTNANPQNGTAFTTTHSGDLIVGAVVCAQASNGFTVGSGYTEIDYSGANAFSMESKTAGGAGSETPSFANSGTCTIGTSVINLVAIAYNEVSTAPTYRNHSSIIRRRIPWDDRKRKLETVRI